MQGAAPVYEHTLRDTRTNFVPERTSLLYVRIDLCFVVFLYKLRTSMRFFYSRVLFLGAAGYLQMQRSKAMKVCDTHEMTIIG